MTTRLNPYLNFNGDARAAMEFYKSVFGGELLLSTFADFQMAHDPSENDLVMHAHLTSPNDLVLMGADTPASMGYHPGDNYSVSLSGDDDAELRGYWNGLTEGGTIIEPLTVAPWGDAFGMFKDRFGVSWLVNILAPQPEPTD
jgi:PhnB protein